MRTPQFLQSMYQFVFTDKKMSWLWLIVRVYVGWQWLLAGYEKIINPAWVGDSTGAAIIGFIKGALTKTGGLHPDVSLWYAGFLKGAVLPYATTWSYAITYGELLIGLGLVVGLFTSLAAFFGLSMNLNFLFSGTVSTNPQLLVLALFVMLAHKIAGFIGLDYYRLRKNR